MLQKLKQAVAAAVREPSGLDLVKVRAAALQAFESARGALGAASLDGNPVEIDRARKALADAESLFVESDLALEAYRKRITTGAVAVDLATKEAKRKAISAALDALQEAGKGMDKAIEYVAKAGAAIIAAEKAVIAAGADQPTRDDMHRANLSLYAVLAPRLIGFAGFKKIFAASQPTSFAAFLPVSSKG